MAFYSNNFLQKRRKWWMKNITGVEAFFNGAWYKSTIQEKSLTGDTILIRAVFTDITATAGTITSLRVIDVDGEVAATKSDSITKAAGQGVLIQLELPIIEQEEA